MQSAEHDDKVVADGDIFAEVHTSEKVHHVMADGRVIFSADAAEEDDYVVLGLMGNVHISEEDNDVMIDVALGVNAAEEADGIVNGLAFRDDDVAAELDRVLFRVGGCGREKKCREEQQGREEALSHGDPHSGILRAEQP